MAVGFLLIQWDNFRLMAFFGSRTCCRFLIFLRSHFHENAGVYFSTYAHTGFIDRNKFVDVSKIAIYLIRQVLVGFQACADNIRRNCKTLNFRGGYFVCLDAIVRCSFHGCKYFELPIYIL